MTEEGARARDVAAGVVNRHELEYVGVVSAAEGVGECAAVAEAPDGYSELEEYAACPFAAQVRLKHTNILIKQIFLK